MNVSYKWLREYCDLRLPARELARMLPELGMEVDGIGESGGDTVFELEITANRPDLLSMIGVAREVAAATGAELKIPEVSLKCTGDDIAGRTNVDLKAPDLCIRYTARLVTGVKVAPSPAWLTERLESIGLRPVNNIVDITNFVLMECGQPLHAFDFDKLRGGRIVVRRAGPGEPITVIDGSVIELTDEMLVIADADVPTAVAGVMGGLDTEISDTTTSVLLESALFLPANIRRTSAALGLSSDSSYRFERSTDPRGVDWGSRRAAALIAEISGGAVCDGVIDAGQPPAPELVLKLRPKRTSHVLGVDIPAERQKALLGPLGFRIVSEAPDELEISVPTFRQEVRREADLIGEVARVYGYGKIPQQTQMHVRHVPVQKVDVVSASTRELCAGMGYDEVRTSSFVATDIAERFKHWSAGVNVLRNPVSREEPALRTSLIPQLLATKQVQLNKGTPESAIFELSRVYGVASGRPAEKTCLALLDDGGFASARGALDELLAQFGLAGRTSYAEYADANLAEGQSARLTLGGRALGVAGLVTKDLAALYDLKTAPAVAELDFDLIVEQAVTARHYEPLPKFPAVKRDLCVVVDDAVAWADVETRARAAAGELAESIAFLSEYRGKQIERGKKALAFTVTYRAGDRTLTGEEADEAMAAVAETLKSQLGAELRA